MKEETKDFTSFAAYFRYISRPRNVRRVKDTKIAKESDMFNKSLPYTMQQVACNLLRATCCMHAQHCNNVACSI